MTDDRSPLLIWTDDGAPQSERFGDVYFSKDDGLAESRAVFLTGCGLPDAWATRAHFCVAELGFGTGLNIAALLDLWSRTRPPLGRLSIVSFEGYPLDRTSAARALSAFPEIASGTEALLAVWPDPTPGWHRLDLPELNATLDLAIGQIDQTLPQWSGCADAWFLDGFSPATNPEMWSADVMAAVAARCAPGARIATFTVAGAVRRGLAEQGLVVEKRPGHGRKRERLEATAPGTSAEPPAPTVAVVGAGIAGAALTRAFAAQGLRPLVVEAETPGAGASGFPSALVTPRMDAGDEAIAALYAQALARAGALYAAVPGAVLSHGVLQLEHTPRDTARFAKIAAQPIWPAGAMSLRDAEQTSDDLGEPVTTGGLMMRDALAVRPDAILTAWLKQADMSTAQVAQIDHGPEGWTLTDPHGRTIATADIVVLAAGWGVAGLALDDAPPLAPVKGQADWVEGVNGPAIAWGGYAAPTATGLLFGSTHERGRVDRAVTVEASTRNLGTVAARLPDLAARLEQGLVQSRAAVRATTPDRLPIAGPINDDMGLFVLGGMGSRGFCAAPLLAEHIVALALNRPSPLPADLAARVSPVRFARPLCNPQDG